ncbi:MAG TPA: contractile injection system protein, VgrG/Pvc8 family [Bryobacteraceae bacterium]|nr:contractile injection system protein, VgrG/Pvc8 family [Bryobacteraceae bacterium]
MDLADFSNSNGAFYAPTFLVKVNGQSLTHTLGVAVPQVEVDLALGAAGRFSFTAANTFSDSQHAFLTAYGQPVLELLKFGATVEIALGYGDFSRLPTLITGTITEITTSFSEGGSPELTVAGYDGLFPLTLGKQSRNWKNITDSGVISNLASEYGLDADIQTTQEVHAQIEQNQESDFELMKKLADRNYFEFYVSSSKKLRFGKPNDKSDGIVDLLWGRTLLNFKPEANLAAQVSQVEVYGWDPQQKKAIVGKAVAGDESGRDPRRQSGGERLRAVVRKAPVLQVRQPVFTTAEADRRAKAILNEHAKNFLTGEAESIGLPDLQPDRNINLGNLGDPFSKTYYIQQTTHKVDGSGYRTRVKVKETSL